MSPFFQSYKTFFWFLFRCWSGVRGLPHSRERPMVLVWNEKSLDQERRYGVLVSLKILKLNSLNKVFQPTLVLVSSTRTRRIWTNWTNTHRILSIKNNDCLNFDYMKKKLHASTAVGPLNKTSRQKILDCRLQKFAKSLSIPEVLIFEKKLKVKYI